MANQAAFQHPVSSSSTSNIIELKSKEERDVMVRLVSKDDYSFEKLQLAIAAYRVRYR